MPEARDVDRGHRADDQHRAAERHCGSSDLLMQLDPAAHHQNRLHDEQAAAAPEHARACRWTTAWQRRPGLDLRAIRVGESRKDDHRGDNRHRRRRIDRRAGPSAALESRVVTVSRRLLKGALCNGVLCTGRRCSRRTFARRRDHSRWSAARAIGHVFPLPHSSIWCVRNARRPVLSPWHRRRAQ